MLLNPKPFECRHDVTNGKLKRCGKGPSGHIPMKYKYLLCLDMGQTANVFIVYGNILKSQKYPKHFWYQAFKTKETSPVIQFYTRSSSIIMRAQKNNCSTACIQQTKICSHGWRNHAHREPGSFPKPTEITSS